MKDKTLLAEKTSELVKGWRKAKDFRDRSKRQLSLAQEELALAEKELGKFLTPDDAVAKKREKFCVWDGNELIECTFSLNVDDEEEYVLRIRPRSPIA